MKKAPKTIKLSCCHICALRIKFFHLVITGNDYIQIVNQFRFRILRNFSQIIHENFLFAMTQDSNEYSFFSAEFFLHIASDLIFVSFCHFQYGNWNWKKKTETNYKHLFSKYKILYVLGCNVNISFCSSGSGRKRKRRKNWVLTMMPTKHKSKKKFAENEELLDNIFHMNVARKKLFFRYCCKWAAAIFIHILFFLFLILEFFFCIISSIVYTYCVWICMQSIFIVCTIYTKKEKQFLTKGLSANLIWFMMRCARLWKKYIDSLLFDALDKIRMRITLFYSWKSKQI